MEMSKAEKAMTTEYVQLHLPRRSEDSLFFILPSSLHEALIVPETLGTDVESLYQMVCEINKTQVAPADMLTDNVYWYDADKKQQPINIFIIVLIAQLCYDRPFFIPGRRDIQKCLHVSLRK